MTRLTLILFLAAIAGAQTTPTLTLTSSTAAAVPAGGTAQVILTLSNSASVSPAASTYQFSIPAVGGQVQCDIGAAAGAAGKGIQCGMLGANLNGVIFGGPTPIADGPLAIIEITYPLTLPGGPVAIALTGVIGADPTGSVVTVAAGPTLSIPTVSACAVTGDPTPSAIDVSAVVAAILFGGRGPILDGGSAPTVVDLQRVINAAAGAPCRLGP